MTHHIITMRTTINIENDVLEMARGLAEAQGMTLGEAVSFLARRGARAEPPLVVKNGFHVFAVASAATFGPEDVSAAVDAEDRARGGSFWRQA
jgi:hypothetical protein